MRTRVRIMCCSVKTLCKCLHSTLLQFSQCVNGNKAIDSGGYVYEKPWRITCTFGWMLPREAEMVSDSYDTESIPRMHVAPYSSTLAVLP